MALPINEICLIRIEQVDFYQLLLTTIKVFGLENQRMAVETREMIAIDCAVCHIPKWATPSIGKHNKFFIDSIIII